MSPEYSIVTLTSSICLACQCLFDGRLRTEELVHDETTPLIPISADTVSSFSQ